MSNQDEKTIMVQDTKAIALSNQDIKEIEGTFSTAKDFRSLGEKITAPIDNIISKTAEIIDKDPIMSISDELDRMNGEVQTVYREIINNDGTFMKVAKSIPFIKTLAVTIDKKLDEASFNIKGIEGKIQMIFSGFDQSLTSLNTSIDLQKDFLEGLEENLGKVIAYKDFLHTKLDEFRVKVEKETDENEKLKYDLFLRNVDFFLSNLVILIGNLEMAKKRLLMRLDSASKLSISMTSSRPIFKTLLSTALIETSSQKALDASLKAISAMGSTIDKMSSELTDKAIESAKKSEEITSKPILSASVFIENVTKLKNHFDQIDSYRKEIDLQAKAEKEAFDDAKKKLNDVKILSAKNQDQLLGELSQ